MPRKTVTANPSLKKARFMDRRGSVDKPSVDDVDDCEDNGEEGVEDDDNMIEMIEMLKEFQKRKASKNTRSPAFQNKKNALFSSSRNNAQSAVREGVAYIEQYKSKIAELKSQEISRAHSIKDLSLFGSREESVRAVLGLFPALFDDLAPRRAEAINQTSSMRMFYVPSDLVIVSSLPLYLTGCALYSLGFPVESHSVQRHRSRARLIKNAKSKIDDDLERQRVATDATALMKHYKALLLS